MKPDSELDSDARLRQIYRDGADEAPPPALDDAIRAAARRATASGPRIARASLDRWRTPLSIAAVVVLSVSLVSVMREEAPELAAPPTADTPESAMTSPAEPAQPDVVDNAVLKRDSNLASRPYREQPAAESQPPAELRRDRAAAPAAPSPEPAPSVQGFSTNPPPAPPVSAPTVKALENDALLDAQSSAPRARDQAADSSVAAKIEQRAATGADVERSSAQATVAPRPAAKPAPRSYAGSEPAPGASAAVQEHLRLPPEQWIEQIDLLIKAGRDVEAKASLDEFRKRHPNYALPDALRTWRSP